MENLVVGGTQHSKILYRELCANEDLIHLFSKDWWLDSVPRSSAMSLLLRLLRYSFMA